MYQKTDTLLLANNIGLSFIEKGKIEEDKDDENYGKPKKKVILSNVNIKIDDIVGKGQKVAVMGKSGVGKTQLIRRLSGLYIHEGINTGEVLIHHDRVQGKHELTPVKEGDMGIVFQDYYMPEHKKIRKMLLKSAEKNREFKGDKKLIKDAVDSYLNEFELMEQKDKYPIQLSGGQKQRACIIMQLVNGSNFLLLDEPFSGLDPIMIDKTTSLLEKVADSDELKTLIIISHDLVNCSAICDTLIVLSKKGRKENTGSTVIANIDLIERGLAYHKDIKKMPEFFNMLDEVKELL